ncbi:MAG: hypothetical protein J6S63_08155 [Atopobiaceae bacterium]|nr:hypothetical protein [Atopobiaceae bacterium]
MADNETSPVDEPLSENLRQIVGGVATLVLIVVPVLLVRKLIKSIEEGKTFKAIERTLGE